MNEFEHNYDLSTEKEIEDVARDAARYRWIIEHWDDPDIPWDELDALLMTKYIDERI